MSLILDALKRSEAERQVKRGPDLYRPPLEASPSRALALIRYLLLILILLAIAVVVIAWLWHNAHSGSDPAATPVPLAQPALETPAANAEALAPTRIEASAAAATPSTEVMDPDLASPTDGEASEPTPTRVAVPAALPVQTVDIQTPSATDTEAAAQLPQPIPMPAVADANARSAPPALERAADAPPLRHELDPKIRSSLPPVRVTVQVYADNPADRFAFIDGRRRIEGDRMPSGLQLKEIRADGLVLVWQSTEFLLPN